MNVVEQVKVELTELAKLGIGKSRLAKNIAYVEARPAEIQGYYDNGMSISGICDHVADLAALK
jgi:hypothetical protein